MSFNTGVLIDNSTFISAATLLQTVNPRMPHGKISWDILPYYHAHLVCLGTVIESIILLDDVYTPTQIICSSEEWKIDDLYTKKIIKPISLEQKQSKNVLVKFRHATARNRWKALKDLSKRLVEEGKDYSVYGAVISDHHDMTICADRVEKNQLVNYAFNPGLSDKWEVTFSYYLKAIYYDFLSQNCDLAYMPHPARVPFLVAWGGGRLQNKPLSKSVFNEIKKFKLNLYEDIDIAYVELPPIFEYILSNSETTNDILSQALEFRSNSSCVRFRKYMRQLTDDLALGNSGTKFAKYMRDLRAMISDLSVELGLDSSEVELTVAGVVQKQFKLPSFLNKSLYFNPNRLHFNWLQSITRASLDFIGTEKLNKLFLVDKTTDF